jgi:hypothetical protein
MTRMAEELRANGPTAKAMQYAEELRSLAKHVGPTVRAQQAAERRPASAPAPTAADSREPGGWFNQVLSQVKTPR